MSPERPALTWAVRLALGLVIGPAFIVALTVFGLAATSLAGRHPSPAPVLGAAAVGPARC